MVIGVNCGHTVSGTPGCGAVGFLNESIETRNVGYEVMKELRKRGHTVYDCTNDNAQSTNGNLKAIIELANKQSLDLFLSIHFNAGAGQGSECWTYGGRDWDEARKINHNLARLGFKNRGIKDGSNLYVIRMAKAKTVLVEVCFVDTKSDAERYIKVGVSKIAAAICDGITGEKINDKEDLTMTQYEELKNEISELTETVKLLVTELHNIKNPMIYNYIDDNMPEWSKPTIQKLVNKGYLQGDDKGLNLTDDLLRILVINDRAGLYD